MYVNCRSEGSWLLHAGGRCRYKDRMQPKEIYGNILHSNCTVMNVLEHGPAYHNDFHIREKGRFYSISFYKFMKELLEIALYFCTSCFFFGVNCKKFGDLNGQ